MSNNPQAKFDIGRVFVELDVVRNTSTAEIDEILKKYEMGDWGTVSDIMHRSNKARLVSRESCAELEGQYMSRNGHTINISTHLQFGRTHIFLKRT